jgi:ferredoxin
MEHDGLSQSSAPMIGMGAGGLEQADASARRPAGLGRARAGERLLTGDIRASHDETEKDASDCISCGHCSSRCPFGGNVVVKMQEAVEVFA